MPSNQICGGTWRKQLHTKKYVYGQERWRTVRRVDFVDGDGVVPTVGCKQPASTWVDLDFGAVASISKVIGDRWNRLHVCQPAGVCIHIISTDAIALLIRGVHDGGERVES